MVGTNKVHIPMAKQIPVANYVHLEISHSKQDAFFH